MDFDGYAAGRILKLAESIHNDIKRRDFDCLAERETEMRNIARMISENESGCMTAIAGSVIGGCVKNVSDIRAGGFSMDSALALDLLAEWIRGTAKRIINEGVATR